MHDWENMRKQFVDGFVDDCSTDLIAIGLSMTRAREEGYYFSHVHFKDHNRAWSEFAMHHHPDKRGGKSQLSRAFLSPSRAWLRALATMGPNTFAKMHCAGRCCLGPSLRDEHAAGNCLMDRPQPCLYIYQLHLYIFTKLPFIANMIAN